MNNEENSKLMNAVLNHNKIKEAHTFNKNIIYGKVCNFINHFITTNTTNTGIFCS